MPSSTIEMLSDLLVDVLDVTLCARHANWNARGPDFLPVHELLDEVGDQLDAQAELIARRIRLLGGTAGATSHAIATRSSFKPYPVEVAGGQDHIEALAQRLGLLSAALRLSIHESRGALDAVTARVLIRVSDSIEQVLWRVESHLLETR